MSKFSSDPALQAEVHFERLEREQEEIEAMDYDWDAHHRDEMAHQQRLYEKEMKLELERTKQEVRAEHSVIQIAPDAKVALALRGAFAVVSEVRKWGVLADVPVVNLSMLENTYHAFEFIAPVRLEWGAFKLVGQVQYDPADFQV